MRGYLAGDTGSFSKTIHPDRVQPIWNNTINYIEIYENNNVVSDAKIYNLDIILVVEGKARGIIPKHTE